jgi:NAD(P)-dependent dehydrogenase (short-subunit alcohol dehydrogenase family)
MTQSLEGKTVLIAGGASGAGLALAKQVAANGAKVHIVGRSAEKLERAKAALAGNIVTHVADIGVEADVKALAGKIQKLDHLVTTAADLVFKPFVELDDADISRILASKFWGPVYLVRHLASKLAEGGSITFVSGSAAYKAAPGGSVIAAANASLDGLARTLALELAPTRVNVVSPGIFDGSTWDFLDDATRKQTLDSIGQSLPTGRVGSVDEIADAVLFVIRNGFATGTVLQIDGGVNA